MPSLKFSRLCLLSEKERRARVLTFSKQQTVLQAPNGHGKSAVLKSLYATLGATPHKIDDLWVSAQVTSILDFSVDGTPYTSVYSAGQYGIFDKDKRLLIRTQSRTKELSPALAKILNFHLVMADRNEETITPPPSYIFAPYYVDQDHGWIKAWSSFKDFYLPRSGPALAEFHSGIRGNDYYKALAERDRLTAESRSIEFDRKSVAYAIEQIGLDNESIAISLDLAEFSADRDRFVREANSLISAQESHRRKVAKVAEEVKLWEQHENLISGALAEIDEQFASALEAPPEVECPTCGSHFENGLAEKFYLVEDTDALVAALISAQANREQSVGVLKEARNDLAEIDERIRNIREILAVDHLDMTLGQIISARGKLDVIEQLREQMAEIDKKLGEISRKIDEQAALMRSATDPRRTKSIRDMLNRTMVQNCVTLDVKPSDRKNQSIHIAGKARGSEGVRELLAYYFAFFGVAREYGTSAFCPLVIDGPNQQGQDAKHLPAMIKFICQKAPDDSQLILGVEDASDVLSLKSDDVEILDVSSADKRILIEGDYEVAAGIWRGFMTELVFGDSVGG